MEKTCAKCGSDKLISHEQTAREGQIHTKLSCGICGTFIDMGVTGVKEPKDFVLTFGKHCYKSLEEINRIDPGYLKWLAKDFREGVTKTVVKKFLETLKK